MTSGHRTESSLPGKSGGKGWAFFSSYQPGPRALVCLCVCFVALLISRRPDCVFNPQLWAEEGKVFLAAAWSKPGWVNVATPYMGYFDLSIRLIHEIAVQFPLKWIPRIIVCVGIVFHASVPAFLVSRRCANLISSFPLRLAAAVLFCGMPNTNETHVVEAHSRIFLAILAMLVLVATPPRTRGGRIFDTCVLVLSGFSGPFILLIAPIAAYHAWEKSSALPPHCAPAGNGKPPGLRAALRLHFGRDADAWRNLWILAILFLFGILAFLCSGSRMTNGPRGATFLRLVRIVGGNMVMSFFAGTRHSAAFIGHNGFDLAACLLFTALLLLLAAMSWQGGVETRCLLLFGYGALALALYQPLASRDMPQWQALCFATCGSRYWVPPMAVTLFAIARAASLPGNILSRTTAVVLLLVNCAFGVRTDWKLPPYVDMHWQDYAASYDNLAPGQSIVIPINPVPWSMTLTKPAR